MSLRNNWHEVSLEQKEMIGNCENKNDFTSILNKQQFFREGFLTLYDGDGKKNLLRKII